MELISSILTAVEVSLGLVSLWREFHRSKSKRRKHRRRYGAKAHGGH